MRSGTASPILRPMSSPELKLRVTFATSALLALAAVLAQVAGSDGRTNWAVVSALAAGLSVSAAEALGLHRLARRRPWRLLAAVLLGVAALYALECQLSGLGVH